MVKGNAVEALERAGQKCLDAILHWWSKHKLAVSTRKTVGLMAKGFLRAEDIPKIRNEAGEPITFVDKAKYLGVWIDMGPNSEATARKQGKRPKRASASLEQWQGPTGDSAAKNF